MVRGGEGEGGVWTDRGVHVDVLVINLLLKA